MCSIVCRVVSRRVVLCSAVCVVTLAREGIRSGLSGGAAARGPSVFLFRNEPNRIDTIRSRRLRRRLRLRAPLQLY